MANQKLTHTIEWEQIGGNYRIIKLTGSKRQPTLDEAREYLREHHLPEEIWCCGFYKRQHDNRNHCGIDHTGRNAHRNIFGHCGRDKVDQL